MSKHCEKPYFTPEQISQLLISFNETMAHKGLECDAALLSGVRKYVNKTKTEYENQILKGVLEHKYVFFTVKGMVMFGSAKQSSEIKQFMGKFTEDEKILATLVANLLKSGRIEARCITPEKVE